MCNLYYAYYLLCIVSSRLLCKSPCMVLTCLHHAFNAALLLMPTFTSPLLPVKACPKYLLFGIGEHLLDRQQHAMHVTPSGAPAGWAPSAIPAHCISKVKEEERLVTWGMESISAPHAACAGCAKRNKSSVC